MPEVGIVIPFRTNDRWRRDLWRWASARFAAQLPDATLVTASDGLAEGPFSRARAVNRGVDMVGGDVDVLVIADGDVAVSTEALDYAIGIVGGAEGDHHPANTPWVLPYTTYLHLDEQVTEGLVSLPPSIEFLPTIAPANVLKRFTAETEPVSRFGGSVCGVVVVRRDAFEAVGGYDERFIGWGWEDTSLAAALWTMVGPASRLYGEVYHLWHPLDPLRFSNKPNRALGRRYTTAMGDPEAMRAILGEEDRRP